MVPITTQNAHTAALAAKYGPQAAEPRYSPSELAGIDVEHFKRMWEQATKPRSTGKGLEERGEVQEDQR